MYHQEFSEDIRRIATTIEDETNQIISRNELIIAIINQIDAYLKILMIIPICMNISKNLL